MNDLEKYHNQTITQGCADFEGPPEPGSESTSSLVIGILRRWYIVLLTFLVLWLTGMPAIWLLIKPQYSVTGAIRVAPILPNILTGEADKGEISNYQSFMHTQAEMVTTDRVVQRVADNLADKNLAFFKNESTNLVKKIKQKLKGTKTNPEPASMLKQAISDGIITVAPVHRTELIQVTMRSRNSGEAKQIVDAFINAYMAVEVSSSAQGEEQKLRVLENERKALAKKLQSQHEAIRQLAQEYGTVSLGSRQDMMLQRVTVLLATLTKIEARRINLESQVQFLEDANKPDIATEDLLTMRNEYINSDPTVQELTENIVQLEKELIIAKQTLAPGNPDLQRKKQLLDAFQTHLEEKRSKVAKDFDDMISKETNKASKQQLLNAQAELERTKAYEKRLQEVLSKEDTQTIELGRRQLRIQDLQFQLDLDKEMYDRVLRRIQELEMERKRPARVSIAYNADVSHIRDKRAKYSAALVFFAFACGCGLAFLRDKADKSLRTPDDVVKRIGIRIIGTTTSPDTIRRALLPSQVAQDYQTIHANLGLLDGGSMPKKLVVTSPGQREGKTTFAINLATSMSKSGQKVLLIDGDLRKPDIAHLLNLPKGSGGLHDVLFGRKLDQVVYSMPSTGLDVLAADSHSAADAYELLASLQTAGRINMVSQKYDHVIIDTPPVLAFPDALLWAKIADAVILTSFAGQTTAPDLKETKERLAEIGVRVLGTVLSNVQVGHSYYRYGYNYYSQDGHRKKRKPAQADTKLLLPMQSSKDDSGDINT
jgi:capsular exopolysaccharide synthesis family protein